MTEQEFNELVTKDFIRENIRVNFNYLRGQLGLKQEEMAAKLNTTRANIGTIEEGRSAAIDIVCRMANVCNIRLETLMLTNMNQDGEKFGKAGRPWPKKETPQD